MIRKAIKSWLNYRLARQPRLYQQGLRVRQHPNREKLVFLRFIKDGDVVLDLGANRGYYTTLFSHIVGPGGAVHAFEPSPTTFAMLRANLDADLRFANVQLNNVGVSDVAGETKLYMPDQDDGQASLRQHKVGSWQDVRRVTEYVCPLVTLDQYCHDQVMRPISFIKCDVEGAELLAFKGGAETLRRDSPLIHVEISAAWEVSFGYGPREVFGLLRELGYREFFDAEADSGNGLVRLAEPETELAARSYSTNVLCARRDPC